MAKPYMCGDEPAIYIPSGGCDCNYTLVEVETDEFAGLYQLMLNGQAIGDPVEVPLDIYVKAGTVGEVVAPNNPYDGAEVGDRYFELTFENSDHKVYIPLGALDLQNYYTKDEVDALIPQISSCDLYPVGSVVITSTNDNPSSYLCGEWELIDKEFEYTVISDTGVTWSSANTQGSVDENSRRAYIIRSGHSISIRLWCENKNDLSNQSGETQLCTIAYSTLGVTSFYQHFVMGQTHTNKNAVFIVRSGNSDPVSVSYAGLATYATQTQIDAGHELYIDFVHVAGYTNMADSACNKFYWERIADSE